MSMDNGPGPGLDNPVAGISPPEKSSKKLWIFGGLGCLGLIGLCCVGVVIGGYFLGKPTLDFMNENKNFVESSPKVQEVLGSPVTAGPPSQPVANPNVPGSMTFRGRADGPNASGEYVIEAKMEGVTPVRQKIYLEVDGETIDLDPEAMFDISIDDGG